MKKNMLIVTVLIVLFAIGCLTKPEVLRFGVIKPSIDHLPYTWAMEKGLLDKTKYETVHFTSGWEIQEALIAGRIDAAILPFTYVWNAAAKGYPVKTVSFFERETDGIVAQPHIRDAQDLKDKKIGILRASTLDVLWQDYAENMGISAHPVYFRTPSEAVAALQNKDVDAIVIYVPIINKLSNKYRVIHWFGDSYRAHPCCDLAINTDRINSRKEIILHDLYNKLRDVISSMPENRDSVREFVSKHYGLSPDEADAAMKHTVFRMGLEESGKAFQLDMAGFSLRSGYLERIPSFDDVYWDISTR